MRNSWKEQKEQKGTGVENSWIWGSGWKTGGIFLLDSLVHFRLIESFKSAKTRESGEREVWGKGVREPAIVGNGLACLFSYPWWRLWPKSKLGSHAAALLRQPNVSFTAACKWKYLHPQAIAHQKEATYEKPIRSLLHWTFTWRYFIEELKWYQSRCCLNSVMPQFLLCLHICCSIDASCFLSSLFLPSTCVAVSW